MDWFPLCNVTHYSLLKGYSKPKQLVKKCVDNNYKACGISDYKSLSGAVSFFKECKDAGIKPIIGCSFDGFSLFAKNKEGWLDLIQIVSFPDMTVDLCKKGNLFCVGRNEINSPVQNGFYSKSELFEDSFYCNSEEADLHRVLLCSDAGMTMSQAYKSLSSPNPISSYKFFESSSYHVKNRKESIESFVNCADHAYVLDKIYDECEDYNILNDPIVPKFPTPNGETEEEYLKHLCREGWKKNLISAGKVKTEECKQKYLDRFLYEFGVIKEANLFGYFLIVQDIIRYTNDNGWMSGPGRGSAAGCLISYLLGITQVDPIEYNLLFERFYNPSRKKSLPDIDMDVPARKRDQIIDYLRSQYGSDKVGQMVTFGRLQGRSAVKEVFRIRETCGFAEINEITKHFPQEAAISSDLEQMDEDDRSIIMWALINKRNELMDFCFLKDDGSLDGQYSEQFKEAIELEGTFKTQGKHAAGVVISSDPLNKVCPMSTQKNSPEKIVGLEMKDLELLGHVKFDVLGLLTLDKLMAMEESIYGAA